MKEKKYEEKDKIIRETESEISSAMHDLWCTHGDAQKIVLFLEEMKTYWQARAIAEMCKYDGAFSSMLFDGIATGIREDR